LEFPTVSFPSTLSFGSFIFGFTSTFTEPLALSFSPPCSSSSLCDSPRYAQKADYAT
jgi:hypothetical protein